MIKNVAQKVLFTLERAEVIKLRGQWLPKPLGNKTECKHSMALLFQLGCFDCEIRLKMKKSKCDA